MSSNESRATVESIMRRRPVTVHMDEPLWKVRNLMHARRFHHVLVATGDRIVGIVSDRDVLRALSPAADKPNVARTSDLATLETRVHLIMSREIISVSPSTPIVDATRTLLERRINCLPVLEEDGYCVGIITSYDVLCWCVDQLAPQEEREAA